MKKYALFGLGSAVAMSLLACSVGETSEGNANEVSNYEDLPLCSAKKGLSGVSYLGQKFYVEEEDAYYLCKETGWALSDASPVVPGNGNVSVVIDSNTVVGSAFASGYFEVGSPVILREMILDPKKGELKESGTIYNDEVSSANGNFVISNVSLYSNYALIEVTGLYKDMKLGEMASDSIKLRTIVDLSDTSDIQVDLFSELTLPRVKALVKNGYSVSAAKVQAEHELLSVLGFGGAVEDRDAAMLATTILFSNMGSSSDMMKSVTAFADAFANNGTWDDSKTRTAWADFAYNLENLKIRDEETNDVILRTSVYRKNLEANGMAKVPGFEAYITKFWNAEYGLGLCGESRETVVLKNANEGSDSANAYFICKSSAWAIASEFERDTLGLGAALDGTIAEGIVDAEKLYVYDSTGVGNGKANGWLPVETVMWDKGREDGLVADSLVLDQWIGYACTDFEDVRYTVAMTIDADEDTTLWGCDNRKWSSDGMNEFIYEIGSLCHEGIFDFDGVQTVEIDKKTRYMHCDSTISESGKDTTWAWTYLTEYDVDNGVCDEDHVDNYGTVLKIKEKGGDKYVRCGYNGTKFGWGFDAATKADYENQDEDSCDPSSVVFKSKVGYVCSDSVMKNKTVLYYTWRVADEMEADLGEVCSGEVNKDKVIKDGTDYYRCEKTLLGGYAWRNSDKLYYLVQENDVACTPTELVELDLGSGSNTYVCGIKEIIVDENEVPVDTTFYWRQKSTAETKAGKPCNATVAAAKVVIESGSDSYTCAYSYYSSLGYQLAYSAEDYEFFREDYLSWYSTTDYKTKLQ